jgi:hypothetical protein
MWGASGLEGGMRGSLGIDEARIYGETRKELFDTSIGEGRVCDGSK